MAAVLAISLVTPSERSPGRAVEELTPEAFRERLMHHWYPPEQGDTKPAADAILLLGVEPGDTLDGGWTVRGVWANEQTLRVELGQAHAVYVLVVANAGRRELPPVRTERYEITEEGRRPAASAFEGLDVEKPRADLEKRIRERELKVPVPEALRSPS